MGRRKLIGFILAGLLGCASLAYAQESGREALALEYMRNGQWDFANQQWRQLIEEEPDNLRAHIGLARSLSQGGSLQEAAWHLENLRSRLQPAGLPEVDVELAQVWLAMRNPSMALKYLLEAIREKPYHVEAFRALVALRDQLPEKTRDALEANLQKRAGKAAVLARKAMEAGRYRQSLPYFEVALAWADSPGLSNDYGLALLLSGEGEEAVRRFRVMPDHPGAWRWHANAALAYLSLDQTAAARREAEKAITLTDGSREKARLYNILGYIYESARKTSEARFAYERAVELDPGLDKARLNLAYIFQQTYQFPLAVRVYEEMLARHPGDGALWNRLGFVYELMHEGRKARAAYEKAIAASPSLREAYTNLALLYKKMDEPDKADAVLKKAMALQFSGLEERGGPAVKRTGTVSHPLFRYVDVFMADGRV